MKVVYVITGLDRGGAETQLRDLAIEMSRRGHQVQVVSLMKPKAYGQEMTAEGVSVVTLGMPQDPKDILALVRALFQLRRLLRVAAPDIVHAHMVHANLLTRAAVLGGGLKLICTAHSVNEGGRIREVAYRFSNWICALNTTVSDAATKRFIDRKIFPATTITIYNGIDVTRFVPASSKNSNSGGFRWIAVGRLDESKDHATLLRAFCLLGEGHHLDIVGSGILYPHLDAQVERMGLRGKVQFLGTRDDVPDLMPRYDGFVLSSAWEGFGLVVAEAMACGLPVVATRSGGPQEILGEVPTAGYLVPVKDAQALASAMQALATQNSKEREAMGREGRGRVMSKFSMEAIVDRWEDVYGLVSRGLAVR